jgi:trigger factor
VEESLKELDNCKREFEATLSYEELQPYFDEAIAEQRKKLTLPGFRKGKVPLNLIRKNFGDSIEHLAVEDIANKVFRDYVLKNKIDIVTAGSLDFIEYQPKDNLKFKINFEVRPDVELKNYKGIELTKINYEVDEEFVDSEVKLHLYQNSSFELDGEALDDEYRLTMDVNNLDENGELIIGQSEKDVHVYLNNPDLLPEIKSALRGIREGEERIIDMKNSEGVPVKTKVTIKRVEKVIPPELNEELFKKLSGKDDVKTEQEFRETIRKSLENYYENESKKQLSAATIKKLIDSNPIPIPEFYIENIIDGMYKNYEERLKRKLTPEEKEQMKNSSRPIAHEQASWYMIREKIIELEDLKLTEDDFAEMVKLNFERFNIPPDKLLETYMKNPSLTENLLTEKVIDFVVSNANVTEETKKIETQKTETQI